MNTPTNAIDNFKCFKRKKRKCMSEYMRKYENKCRNTMRVCKEIIQLTKKEKRKYTIT